jgi:splicing factor 45
VNGFYAGEKRQRGGRKRRKKNKEDHIVVQDWDDIYDPSRPNSYEEYKHSDEKIREVREWKDRLYAHRDARRAISDRDSDDEDDYRPQMSSKRRSRIYGNILTERRPICAASELLLRSTTNRFSSSKACGRCRL